MSPPQFRGLWLLIAIPVLAFVAVGSLVIVWWLHAEAQRESRNLFGTLARTNAALIRSTQLPRNAESARDLGRALRMDVFFRRGAWSIRSLGSGGMDARPTSELVPAPVGTLADHAQLLTRLQPAEGIIHAGRDHEIIAVEIDPDAALILARPLARPTTLLFSPATLAILLLFWILSIALTWAITQAVVRPLQRLTDYLPLIGTDTRAMPPGVERQDEIGQLARAYLSTRTLLKEEQGRRAQSERLALLGRMATGLAHEIHNPLAAIRLHAQLLDSTPDETFAPAARDSLPILLEETSRIEGLVNQWMFLARPAPPSTARASMDELLVAVLRAHEPLMKHARVALHRAIEPGLFAEVDSRRLTQAIRNVVVNAVHAMPTGGDLTIAAGRRGGNICMTFQDTGPGFSPAALARHAELFYSEKEGGMGIGLSVSTEILKAHRGVLSVENRPQGGALVTFLIPAAP